MRWRDMERFATNTVMMLLTVSWLVSAATPSSAQVPAEPDPGQVPPDRIAPSPPGSGDGSLSEQLDATDGVIRPPAGIDPGLVEPPPAGGATPVIPPSVIPPGGRQDGSPSE